MTRVYNFCAGPSMLPAEVMAKAQLELNNWQGMGVSVMEISHRSREYIEMTEKSEQCLRDLLAVPENYKILFCHGGGRGQFAAVPMNLLGKKKLISYLTTGHWSKSAVDEGQKYARVEVFDALTDNDGLQAVLPTSEWCYNSDAAYLHYCPNETIEGIAVSQAPQADIPVVADMSSTILSEPLDVSKFGVIYAGSQKNIGPSGLAIAIVREDLLGQATFHIPSIMDYSVLAENGSMFNTPPTYAWYLASLVFEWIKDQGGLKSMAERNRKKASLLYNYIDESDFYRNSVVLGNRSKMNVPFRLADKSLNDLFLKEAAENGLTRLKGHRAVDGMRASIYNAMPLEGVQALVNFMRQFVKRYG